MPSPLRSCAILCPTAACVCLYLLLGVPMVDAAPIQPLPPHSVVEGRRLDEWSQAWWKWALTMSGPPDPFQDVTGAAANRDQSGAVFFLTNNLALNQPITRSFTVPQGKYLYLPLIPGVYSSLFGEGNTEAELRQTAAQNLVTVHSLFATIDGVAVPDPYAHRETTPPGLTFEIDAVPNNPFSSAGAAAGHGDIAITDGYWLMVPPLSPGEHVFHYGGQIGTPTRYGTDVTARITVVPEPAAVGLAAAGALFGVRRRRIH